MNYKYSIPLFALVLVLSMGLYFLLNPSYERSLKAKYYYETGEYATSLELSREAFSMDVYNRMASTIMAQSIISLKYVQYIADGKKYMLEINAIAAHKEISEADKAKIRLICNIMMDSYVKLAPSVVTGKNLVDDAANYYKSFEKLLEKVNK